VALTTYFQELEQGLPFVVPPVLLLPHCLLPRQSDLAYEFGLKLSACQGIYASDSIYQDNTSTGVGLLGELLQEQAQD
jgi:hypothetical protein